MESGKGDADRPRGSLEKELRDGSGSKAMEAGSTEWRTAEQGLGGLTVGGRSMRRSRAIEAGEAGGVLDGDAGPDGSLARAPGPPELAPPVVARGGTARKGGGRRSRSPTSGKAAAREPNGGGRREAAGAMRSGRGRVGIGNEGDGARGRH